MAKCGQCDREVRFYRSATTGKPIPIDPQPVHIGGNVWLSAGEAHVLHKGETHEGPLYSTHFATCPARSPAGVDDTVYVSPLDGVRRVRREIEEERATKRSSQAKDATQGAPDLEPAAAQADETQPPADSAEVGQDDRA